MNQIIKKHWRFLAMAIVITTVSSLTAVFVQFEKGRVLDYALARQAPQALRSGAILLALILLELATYYAYNIFSSKFFLNGVKSLREAFFTATLRRKYPDFRDKAQGEYLAMYTDQIDKVQKQYIETIIWMFEISIKALSVSIGLFVLDWRLALITLFLLTTPLYVPKLVEQKLQKAQKESAKVFEAHLAKFTDWLNSFELIKNFNIENKILGKYRESIAQVFATDYRRQILNYRYWLVSSSSLTCHTSSSSLLRELWFCVASSVPGSFCRHRHDRPAFHAYFGTVGLHAKLCGCQTHSGRFGEFHCFSTQANA